MSLEEHPLPPEEQAILDQFRELARERFAQRAAMYDEKGVFPTDNFDDLKARGLTALRVPKEFGGKGISSLGYVKCLREIAKVCASTALTFNMHTSVAYFLTHMGTPAQQRMWGEKLAKGLILGSLGSEPFNNPFLPGAIAALDAQLARDGDGYRLKTRKAWCSLGEYADAYVVYAVTENAKDLSDGLVFAVVPRSSPGVKIINDWDSVSMRATSSVTIDFDVKIPESNIVGTPGELVKSMLRSEYALGYCTVYYSIGEAALDFAMGAGKTTLAHALAPGRDLMNPDITRLISEVGYLRANLRPLWITLQQTALNTTPGTPERRRALFSLKAVIAEKCADLVQRAIRIAGAKSLYKKFPVQRQYRDVLAGLVMSTRPEHGYYMLGYEELGVAEIIKGPSIDGA